MYSKYNPAVRMIRNMDDRKIIVMFGLDVKGIMGMSRVISMSKIRKIIEIRKN